MSNEEIWAIVKDLPDDQQDQLLIILRTYQRENPTPSDGLHHPAS